MSKFDSILVANRGEIAVRVMRTAEALGYRIIAIYSEADAGAPHVALADEAYLVGPPQVGESYLNAERVLEAARNSGAQAIHPGYGFFSENADFAEQCQEAGLIFIGPSPEAIRAMGNKAEAKRLMLASGVPCIPGYQAEDQSDTALTAAAEEIGYPLMVKAAAGGGGRGIRLVEAAADLAAALTAARSEAANAFGSDELILERALVRPRHVEVQVFADSQGNAVYLGERDCSVQRRHQKVIEEAPSPAVTPELRRDMGEAAVKAARSIDYSNAGTVEFLLDASGGRDGGDFYFLEMNTRLQVEHPVTEMITGLDLVALQISVAQGAPLGLEQESIDFTGHAIEARLYAEDPANDFLPSSGTAESWQPATGDGVRIDHGLMAGQEIPPYYDSLVAKVIAWGEDREIARRRLARVLRNTVLLGPESNKDFLVDILGNPTFANGEATTAFIPEEFPGDSLAARAPSAEQAAAAAVLQYCAERRVSAEQSPVGHQTMAAGELQNWYNAGKLHSHYKYALADDDLDLMVTAQNESDYRVASGDREIAVSVHGLDGGAAVLSVDGARKQAHFNTAASEIHLAIDGASFRLQNQIAFAVTAATAAGSGAVVAPMHGNVLRVLASVGDNVAEGDALIILEAMKMEHEVAATVTGQVKDVKIAAGTQVSAGALLVEIEPAEDA